MIFFKKFVKINFIKMVVENLFGGIDMRIVKIVDKNFVSNVVS